MAHKNRENKHHTYYCWACLISKEQMSNKDIRYCADCQPDIEAEYQLVADTFKHKSKYIPVPPRRNEN